MPEAWKRQVPFELAELVFSPESPFADVVRRSLAVARTDAVLLLTGERGTGKRSLAGFLHARSLRASRPLVEVDCAALDEATLERQLFGVGAPDGGASVRGGRVAECDGGTLLLANVDALPPALQRRLLRLLQDRRYEPAGSTASFSADVRIFASTHRDLSAEVVVGRFRRDLYFRLLACPVELPPLRERSGDVALLFLHFWRELGEERPVDPAVLHALERHTWPGNLRELELLATECASRATGETLSLGDLPLALHPPEGEARVPSRPVLALAPPLRAAPEEPAPPVRPGAGEAHLRLVPSEGFGLPVDLAGMLRQLEDAYIDAALRQTGGNKRAAADLLGLQRTTLVEKLRRRRDRRDGEVRDAQD